MRRRLAIAALLGVVLLAAVALAAELLWHCPRPDCFGGPGTAYYKCPTHGVFTAVAYYTDDYDGPPDRLCPSCPPDDSVWCSADSAVCNANSTHRWYAPFWEGYK
jgi:hypothetical protein